MRVASLLKTAVFIAACLPAVLAQDRMKCRDTEDLRPSAYNGTVRACGDLIREVTDLTHGNEIVFPALAEYETWKEAPKFHRKSDWSHCRVRPIDSKPKTEERIPVLEIWTAIEALRWNCTRGYYNVGKQWQVAVEYENHVGKRSALSSLPLRESLPQGPVSHKFVSRQPRHPWQAKPPPAYGWVEFLDFPDFNRLLGLAISGLYYAVYFQHSPLWDRQQVLGYESNYEEGVLNVTSGHLRDLMVARREQSGRIEAPEQTVTLHDGSVWFYRVTMEIPDPPEGDERSIWRWSHPLWLLGKPLESTEEPDVQRSLRLMLEQSVERMSNEQQINGHRIPAWTTGMFIWQMSGAHGLLPADATRELPDIGPYMRITIERGPLYRPPPHGHDPGDLRIRSS